MGGLTTTYEGLSKGESLMLCATLANLPQYQSKKVVRAAEITQATTEGLTLRVGEQTLLVSWEDLPSDLTLRYCPKMGDYLIVYRDGYISVCPKNAFVSGYDTLFR